MGGILDTSTSYLLLFISLCCGLPFCAFSNQELFGNSGHSQRYHKGTAWDIRILGVG